MSTIVRALVTGASGFVGTHLVTALLRQDWQVRGTTRRPWRDSPHGLESTVALDIGPTTDWDSLLDGVDVVFHLASRAHILRESSENPALEFDRVNVQGTAHLVRSCREAGVRRVVYMSSIGVHGDRSEGPALTEASPIRPRNLYAASKVQSEAALVAESGQGLDFVIVRPPLIYGEGVPGNFFRLMRLIASGIPMPLGSLDNLRSLAAVGNVVDLLLLCGTIESAAGEAYVVADGDDISTPELIRTLAEGMGCDARLAPCPISFLKLAARLTGMQRQYEQISGTLQVNASKAHEQLGWTPRFGTHAALTETARWYTRSRRQS